MNDPGKNKATRDERKAERMKAWKKPKAGDVNPETGKKHTAATAKAKIKAMRTERIKAVVPDYEE